MKDRIFFNQARLLLRVLPIINEQKDFALKGGTAINFFVRDFPRLSVDIDLTYLPIADRSTSLQDISNRMEIICTKVQKQLPGTTVNYKYLKGTNYISGAIIISNEVAIKIEPNTVIRGGIFKPKVLRLTKKAEEQFELSLKAQCLSVEDLYGGKICAALDRQHPRDLFDIKLLFENEGLTENIIKGFIFYLISHDRPIVEVLNPSWQNIEPIYENEFIGMTEETIKLEELLNIRGKLISDVRNLLREEQKHFLVSFKNKRPEWKLSGIDNLENYPSVKWKLMNLNKMEKKKHQHAVDKLKEFLL